MKGIQLCLTAALAAAGSWVGAAEISREGAMERMALFAPGTAAAWSASESSIQESNAQTRLGLPSSHWHVTVDHAAGEAKYPVGWPRISRGLPAGPARDWSGWDVLRLWIYTATSRERLPATAAGLGLHTPDRAGAYNRTLAELRKGEWVEIRIPLSQIPRHHDVRQVQFHVAEANYQHGDRLDFYLGDLSLLRYAEPTLLGLVPESAVVFDDAGRIPVRFQLVGVKPGAPLPVVCELWRQGRVVARTQAVAQRGPQRVVLETTGANLAPGTYELQAGLAGGRQSASATVRVVESPWRQQP